MTPTKDTPKSGLIRVSARSDDVFHDATGDATAREKTGIQSRIFLDQMC